MKMNMKLWSIFCAYVGCTQLVQGGATLRGSLSGVPKQIISTYLGAYPNGMPPQPPSELSSDINMVMLSFAKETGDGDFKIADWGSNLTPQTIQDDKQKSGRLFLISLGGAADYGGTFNPTVDVDTWVSNAFSSVSGLITQYNADGAEMQFEGGTGDSRFQGAINALLQKLKDAGFITAIGPFYGGTMNDYSKLSMDNVDLINMQMYTAGTNTVDGQVQQTEEALALFESSVDKFVYGLNSKNRAPEPQVGLQAFQTLLSKYPTLRGLFTWDAEDSLNSCSPAYCIEAGGASILANPSQPYAGDCAWTN